MEPSRHAGMVFSMKVGLAIKRLAEKAGVMSVAGLAHELPLPDS